jgi:hypothetical protein
MNGKGNMTDTGRLSSTLEEYYEVEEKFRENTKCGPYSQIGKIFKELFPKIRKMAIENQLDKWGYEDKLSEAGGVVNSIASAMKTYWTNAPVDMIWNPPWELVDKPNDW